MSQVLKLPEFAEYHGVTQVKVGGRRVHTQFDAQRLRGGHRPSQFAEEFFFGDNADSGLAEPLQLLFRSHWCLGPTSVG